MLAYERSGPRGHTPVLLVHAGVADRRMWDPVWPALTAGHDVVRLDLRGYGESSDPPAGAWSPRSDVLDVLDGLAIDRAHVVGSSFGAGVAVEVALERPAAVESLLLAAPGGALLTERTEELAAFFAAEGAALESDDLDAAVEANLVAWVDGPHRRPDQVDPTMRAAVATMQRRAFEITQPWPDAVWQAEDELAPEAAERLAEVAVRALVISGGLDIDSIRMAADRVAGIVSGARAETWPDVAHLPPMEQPEQFATTVIDWVAD